MAFALRLPDTLGHPATPHNFFPPEMAPVTRVVPGVLYPIEEKGISLEDARNLADDPGCDLELVQIDRNGDEVKAGPKVTKDELVAYAAALDPPLELHASQTKDEMQAAITEHETAIAEAAPAGETGDTDSTEAQDAA